MFKPSFQKWEFFQIGLIGISVWAAVSLSACGVSIVDADSEKNKPAVGETVSNPEYQIIPMAQPNRYQIQFRSDLQSLLSSSDRVVAEKSMATSAGEFCGGCVYQFSFAVGEQSKVIRVKFPRDLVIEDKITAESKISQWKFSTDGRIFIKHSAWLINEDKSLILEADEIISEGAVISNFDKNKAAPAQESGRNGGSILLKAKRITGSLLVSLDGENGGGGLAGQPYERAYQGLSYSGYYGTSCELFKQGGDGGDGKNGRPGGRGGFGGNAGDLILDVKDQAVFDLKIENEEGHGGQGGAGGPGQKGGAGGISGFKLIPGTGPRDTNAPRFFQNEKVVSSLHSPVPHGMVCQGPPGADGKDGAPGFKGPDGHDGLKGKFCTLQERRLVCRR